MAVREPDSEAADLARETGRPIVYLHIGAPKTGTTYLQNILWRNREALRADGVLYPGQKFADHVHAAFDLRNVGGFQGFQDPDVPGAWSRLVDETRDWNGTAIISQELFSPARPKQVERALAMLDFAEVHLVYTARDLVRQIPAAWQEDIKNRHVLGFGDFVASLRDPDGSNHHLGTAFWRMQDAVEVLQRWASGIPPERVHVVTVPPAGQAQNLLWERFAELVGVDPGRYEVPGRGANLSLGSAEATLLRQLNTRLAKKVTWPTYSRLVKHYLAEDVLGGRPDPLKITLPAGEYPWVTARSEELIEGVRKAGYHVVGELADLEPVAAPPSADTPPVDDPPADLRLEAAVDSMAALIGRWEGAAPGGDLKRRVQQLEAELDQRRRQPVKTVVRDISERRPVVMRMRAWWWHTVEYLQGALARLRARS